MPTFIAAGPAPGRDHEPARRKLIQEELAEKLAESMHASPRHVQSVQAGDYFPRLPALVRLRGVLKASENQTNLLLFPSRTGTVQESGAAS